MELRRWRRSWRLRRASSVGPSSGCRAGNLTALLVLVLPLSHSELAAAQRRFATRGLAAASESPGCVSAGLEICITPPKQASTDDKQPVRRANATPLFLSLTSIQNADTRQWAAMLRPFHIMHAPCRSVCASMCERWSLSLAKARQVLRTVRPSFIQTRAVKETAFHATTLRRCLASGRVQV